MNAVECPQCHSYRTMTHYFHLRDNRYPHNFVLPNPPHPPAPVGAPTPQPCPEDGCPAMGPHQPNGDPQFSYCLDCGHAF